MIEEDNIEEFRSHINRLAHDKLRIEDLIPSIDVDMELSLSEIDEKWVNELELLEPTGTGNPEPLFCTRNLRLKGGIQEAGRDTIKFWASDGEFTFQAVGFGMKSLQESLINAQGFDLIYRNESRWFAQ